MRECQLLIYYVTISGNRKTNLYNTNNAYNIINSIYLRLSLGLSTLFS